MGMTIGAAGPARADTMPAIVPTIDRPMELKTRKYAGVQAASR